MKRKFFAILMIIMTALSAIPQGISAAGSKDPYTFVNAAAVDELKCAKTEGKVYDENSGTPYIAYTTTGDSLIFKGYDFDVLPSYIDVNIGGGVGYLCNINVCLDSPSSTPIAVVEYTPSGNNWYKAETVHAKITSEVSGVHDIYFVYARSSANFFGFQFGSYGKVKAKKSLPRYSDLEGTAYQREVSLLTQLEIIPKLSSDDFDLDMPVTRGEFAVYMKNIMSLDEYACPEPTFSDVQPDNSCYESVEYLKSYGVIRGTEGGSFEPYRFITPAEAETMIVRMLGYGNMMEQFGGLSLLCARLGLLDNLSMDTDVVRRSELVTLLWNSLNADYVDIKSVSAVDGKSYPEYEGKKGILSYTRKINRDSGVVLRNETTGLYSPDACTSEGKVLIGSNRYEEGKTPIADYIGYECEYFYDDSSNDDKTILAFEPMKKVKVTTLTTYGDDDELTNMSDRKVTYIRKNDTRTMDIRTDAAFIVNGKACDFDINTLFARNDFSGSVTLIDNGNGVACVYVDYYQNILIESVKQDGGNVKIFDKLTQTEIDLSDVDIVYENSAVAADVSELKRGSYCVIRLSKNTTGKRLCRLYVVDNIIDGRVTRKSDDKIIINDVEYKAAKELSGEPSIGYELRFYINPYNEIVGFDENISSIMFGCFLSCGIDNKDVVRIKLIGQNGELCAYTCKKNLILDGSKQTDGDVIKSILDTVPKKSAVRYKLNNKDEITMLDTVIVGTQSSDDKIELITKFSESGYNYRKNTGMIRKSGSNMYYINPAGYLFSSVKEPQNNDDVSCKLNSDVSTTDSVRWTLYTLNSSDSIADIVVDEDSTSTGVYKSAMIFDEIFKATDPNGDATDVHDYIRGYTVGGASVSYRISENITSGERAVVDALQQGDFLKPKLSGDRYIGAEYLYFPGGDNKRGLKTSVLNSSKFVFGDGDQTYRTGIGYIKEFPENHSTLAKIALGNVDGVCEYISLNGVRVTVVDKNSRLVVANNYPVENLKVGDFVLYNMTNAAVDYLVVYR